MIFVGAFIKRQRRQFGYSAPSSDTRTQFQSNVIAQEKSKFFLLDAIRMAPQPLLPLFCSDSEEPVPQHLRRVGTASDYAIARFARSRQLGI